MLATIKEKRWGCTFDEALRHLYFAFKQWARHNRITCSQQRWTTKKLNMTDAQGPCYPSFDAKALNLPFWQILVSTCCGANPKKCIVLFHTTNNLLSSGPFPKPRKNFTACLTRFCLHFQVKTMKLSKSAGSCGHWGLQQCDLITQKSPQNQIQQYWASMFLRVSFFWWHGKTRVYGINHLDILDSNNPDPKNCLKYMSPLNISWIQS